MARREQSRRVFFVFSYFVIAAFARVSSPRATTPR
jgi:hypothetical protein